MHVAPPLVRDALQQSLHNGLLAHVMLRPTPAELDLIRGPAVLPHGRTQAPAATEDLQGTGRVVVVHRLCRCTELQRRG